MAEELEMMDLGALKYFLAIEVYWSKQGIFLSQWKYTLDLLVEIGNSATKHWGGLWPGYLSQSSSNEQGEISEPSGEVDLSNTKPDLSYAISDVS